MKKDAKRVSVSAKKISVQAKRIEQPTATRPSAGRPAARPVAAAAKSAAARPPAARPVAAVARPAAAAARPAFYDARAYAPEELHIERLDEIATDRATLMRNAYFAGGVVHVCHAGAFRFTFADAEAPIDLQPGETLILFPGNTVTIEALEKGSLLKYAVFGGTRAEEFFASYGFFDRLVFANCTQVEAFDAAVRASATDPARALVFLRDALATFAQHLRTGAKSRLYAALRALHDGVRAGKPRLKDVCNELGLSRATLNRLFAGAGLESPGDCIRALQYRRARRLIMTTDMSFSAIARAVGVSTAAHFTQLIRRYARLSPSELRHRA